MDIKKDIDNPKAQSILKSKKSETKLRPTKIKIIEKDETKNLSQNLNRKSQMSKRRSTRRKSTFIKIKKIRTYLPTYRLEPKILFNQYQCEDILKFIFKTNLDSYKYHSKTAVSMAAGLSEEILFRLKLIFYDRYRLVCVVSVGEKKSQNFCYRSGFLWDTEFDGFGNFTYNTPNFFAIATVYAVYFD